MLLFERKAKSSFKVETTTEQQKTLRLCMQRPCWEGHPVLSQAPVVASKPFTGSGGGGPDGLRLQDPTLLQIRSSVSLGVCPSVWVEIISIHRMMIY